MPSERQITKCFRCMGAGRIRRGFDNRGQPVYGEDCPECLRSGYLPVIDGKPGSWRRAEAILAVERERARRANVARQESML